MSTALETFRPFFAARGGSTAAFLLEVTTFFVPTFETLGRAWASGAHATPVCLSEAAASFRILGTGSPSAMMATQTRPASP